MKKKFLVLSAGLQLITASIFAKNEPFLFAPTTTAQLTINNRILAKVNGKAISVIDVMKKMDLLFYKEFPEYTTSLPARHQFYQANWKHVLNELIEKELIIADSEECKLQVTNGDVRQEMEALFGPNIIANLDKVGLTYDEAFKMLHGDIIIRRMLYLRANVKAMQLVTPRMIRDTYEEYAKKNIRPAEWLYYVISIRSEDPTQAAETANYAYHLLTQEGMPVSDIADKIKKQEALSKGVSFNVSEEYRHQEKDISSAYKASLLPLDKGSYSQPIAQKSRSDKSTVFRIFYLKDKTEGGIIPFKEVENELKEFLLSQAAAKESSAYILKLRQHFDVQDSHLKEMVSDDFQPFLLK